MDLKQYKVAARLADKILKQDDTVIEAWSVAGIANLRRGKVRLASLYLTYAVQLYEKDEKEGELTNEDKVAQANVTVALQECQERIKINSNKSNEIEESSDEEAIEEEDMEMETESLSTQFNSTSIHSAPYSSSSSSTSSSFDESGAMLD